MTDCKIDGNWFGHNSKTDIVDKLNEVAVTKLQSRYNSCKLNLQYDIVYL